MINETRVFRIATQRDRRWAYAHSFLVLAPILLVAILWFQFGGAKNLALLAILAVAPFVIAAALWADFTFRRTAR